MCIQIVLNKDYFLGICITFFKHFFDEMSPAIRVRRKLPVIRTRINFKNIFHRLYKASIFVGRYFPIFAEVRFKFIFLKCYIPSSEKRSALVAGGKWE